MIIALTCGLSHGQVPSSLKTELHIDVVDTFTGAGVEGVSVSLLSTGVDNVTAKQTSDSAGATMFSLAAGARMLLLVEGKGYSKIYRDVIISGEKLSLRIPISKPARIHGAVIDRDSRKPIAALTLRARPTRWFHGARVADGVGKDVKTDKDGKFALDDLPAGDYLLEIGASIRTVGKGDDPDIGYARRMWPGGGGIADSAPLRILSGSDESVGAIELVQQFLYRASVTPGGDGCVDQIYTAELLPGDRTSFIPISDLPARCGEKLVFAGLSSGTYNLQISPKSRGRGTLGYEKFQIGKKHIDIKVPIRAGVPFTGSVLQDGDENKAIPEGISIKLWPQPEDPHQQISTLTLDPGPVAANGLFSGRVFIPPSGKIQFSAFGWPPGFYMEEVKVNGQASTSPVVEVDRFASSLDIRISISPQSGTIEGSIAECKCSARVFAIPQPSEVFDQYPLGALSTEARDGRFTFSRLRPATYRIVAVKPPVDDRLERPGVLIGLAGSSKDVEVPRSRVRLEVPLSAY